MEYVHELNYAKLLYFHDLEWCPDCKVLICHSCKSRCLLIVTQSF